MVYRREIDDGIHLVAMEQVSQVLPIFFAWDTARSAAWISATLFVCRIPLTGSETFLHEDI
jgi:hypothetical protein